MEERVFKLKLGKRLSKPAAGAPTCSRLKPFGMVSRPVLRVPKAGHRPALLPVATVGNLKNRVCQGFERASGAMPFGNSVRGRARKIKGFSDGLIPKGLRHSAQGCRACEATLGYGSEVFSNPDSDLCKSPVAALLFKSPVAALYERRRDGDFLENLGGHRPPLQRKATFAEVSERVASNPAGEDATPLGLINISIRSPRAARPVEYRFNGIYATWAELFHRPSSSQLWAERWNPVGILSQFGCRFSTSE